MRTSCNIVRQILWERLEHTRVFSCYIYLAMSLKLFSTGGPKEKYSYRQENRVNPVSCLVCDGRTICFANSVFFVKISSQSNFFSAKTNLKIIHTTNYFQKALSISMTVKLRLFTKQGDSNMCAFFKRPSQTNNYLHGHFMIWPRKSLDFKSFKETTTDNIGMVWVFFSE